MLKNLKVTIKIAVGFGIILTLLAFIASQGYIKLQESFDGFTEYRTLARDTNLMGRIQANLLLTRLGAVHFAESGAEAALNQYNEKVSKLSGFITEAKSEMTDSHQKELINQIESNLKIYDSKFRNIVEHKRSEQESITSAVKSGEVILNGLNNLLESAKEREDNFMTSIVEKSIAALYKARLANAAFIYHTKKEEDAQKALAAFDIFEKNLNDIQNILYTPADLALINSMRASIKDYIQNTQQIITATVEQAKAKQSLDSTGPVLAQLIEDMKISVMKEQDTLGPAMQASISAATKQTMTISGVTFAVGLLLAFFISRSITSPLRKASRFVHDIAEGNFNSSIDVNQKDEVGMICADVVQVGNTLKKVMSEIDATINDIELGKIDSKADPSKFEGSFAELMERTNQAMEVLRSFLDQIPMPIMTIDKSMNLLYMNKTGVELLGKNLDDLKKGKCADFMKTEDCQKGNCACAKAMKSSQKVSSSTIVRGVSGQELDIDYTGNPIVKNGEVVGAMEVVLDQTAVRATQKRMLNVAERTQVIAEQLSSASEELAAQVEQISLGSENQRERIVETATAMDQMNSTIMEVAQNASSASGKSHEASRQASDGAQIVSRSVTSISEVQTIAEELRENMQKLGEQTESISTVMDVISDIADQTNLLALNAAIEAARAGEAGRGFAVVADEVRKLAEKTVTATHEVGKNVESIQESVRHNMRGVETAVGAVQQTTELAGESGKSLESIVRTVEFSASQVESIATASEEQSAASEQINLAINEINNVARETTEGIRQSAKAVQELAVMSSELTELINELRSE